MARIILLTDFSEAYARGLLYGMTRYAKDRGEAWSFYRFPLSIRDKSGIEAVLSWALKMNADAVIGQFYNTDNVELFREHGIIAVAQDFRSRFTTIPNITGAYRLTGKMAAEHLINRGFRHFAFYGTRGIVWSDERYQGFRDTIRQANPEFTLSTMQSKSQDDLWYYDTYQLVSWLESLPKPVAIMACDDNQAYQLSEVCRHCEKTGNTRMRIPDDIALIGVDNDVTLCEMSDPNLSSIAQGIEQGGYDTAALIERLMKEPDATWEDVVVQPTHIITRRSTEIYAHSDPHIVKVLKYIFEHIDRKISVDELVALCPLSRRLLETRFKHEMGTSIYDFITRVRVEKLAQMLAEGMSITEAAAELGFADIKNLSRIFRKIKEVTPSEYQRQHRRKALK